MSDGRPEATPRLADTELDALDRIVREALARGDETALPVLGYGEISLVLAWPPADPAFACKRLPPFPSRQRLEAYRQTLIDYVEALRAAGIPVAETELRAVEGDGEGAAGYVVQPILPARSVAPAVLARADPAAGHPVVAAVVDSAAAAVGPRLGLDAQLSNWTWEDGELSYIDVSTPLIWSADGRSRFDLDLIAQAFPWALRAPLRRFVAPGILDTYRDLRKVYLDLCGNLIKEGLGRWLPAFIGRLNRHLDEPLAAAEVERYHRSDRRLWGALLWARRIDRAWQRHVRRRAYPFLLPRATGR
ncbi:MAG TPA: DUF6206 family protein [Solirubrobacterales bacterium]|nr:DUF6206 family protein [Solirubrobacterales bacterium]